jgi:hypothetical protein
VDFIFHQQSLDYWSVLFGPFYWWRKPEFPEKNTDLPQVTGKLYQIEITLVLLPINNSQATVKLFAWALILRKLEKAK